MNRKLRTTLPILPMDLKPKVPDYSKLQSSEKSQRNKQKQNFDSRHAAHSLIPLKEGITVWIPDHNCAGKVITQVRPQSYKVKTSSTVLRRNRRHLIASPNEQFDDKNTDLDSLPDVSNNDSVTIPTSEPTVQPTRDGTVYTHSGRASRPPKCYTPDNS